MILSGSSVRSIKSGDIALPPDEVFTYPEKILQFGTGVLLRGLPDYFVDKANRAGKFKGRIVIVKSTSGGDADAFKKQDGLYTICVRGVDEGKKAEENIISSAVSRVLSAKTEWKEILACASNPALRIVISNTTEVGLVLKKESVKLEPPESFPAKLLAFLLERYRVFGDRDDSGLVIIPTELIVDNGSKLRGILNDLAIFNSLDEAFI
ncbi:MAG: altronate oxidoreductase, partial [Flavitalea sp.]